LGTFDAFRGLLSARFFKHHGDLGEIRHVAQGGKHLVDLKHIKRPGIKAQCRISNSQGYTHAGTRRHEKVELGLFAFVDVETAEKCNVHRYFKCLQ